MTSSGWLMLMLTLTLLQHHRSRCPRGQRATAPSVGEPRKQACWPFVAAHTTLLPLCGGCSGHDLGWGTGRQVTSCLDRHESVPFPSFTPRAERRGDLALRDLSDLVDYIVHVHGFRSESDTALMLQNCQFAPPFKARDIFPVSYVS